MFVCTYNSVRSQIAEGLLKALAPSKFEVRSAGVSPTGVNPIAIEVMKEIGIDISSQYSKDIRDFLDEKFDYVITVCEEADKSCPLFPDKAKRISWSIKDPGTTIGNQENIVWAFRKTRDTLKDLISQFIRNKD